LLAIGGTVLPVRSPNPSYGVPTVGGDLASRRMCERIEEAARLVFAARSAESDAVAAFGVSPGCDGLVSEEPEPVDPNSVWLPALSHRATSDAAIRRSVPPALNAINSPLEIRL
jgi:hypothetical protein